MKNWTKIFVCGEKRTKLSYGRVEEKHHHSIASKIDHSRSLFFGIFWDSLISLGCIGILIYTLGFSKLYPIKFKRYFWGTLSKKFWSTRLVSIIDGLVLFTIDRWDSRPDRVWVLGVRVEPVKVKVHGQSRHKMRVRCESTGETRTAIKTMRCRDFLVKTVQRWGRMENMKHL